MDFSFLEEFNNSKAKMLKSQIADAIRSAIIKGKLKPGQQLQQDKIAAALGVSSIPVREALSALREEQHIVYHPNRGAFVSEIDADKVQETFEIRYFLEAGALSLALPKCSEEHFDEVARLMRLEAQETDADQKTRLDLAFHLALCEPCQRPNLLRMIEQIHSHVARYVNLTVYIMNFKRHSRFHHEELFNACCNREIDRASLVLKNHLMYASSIICANFNQ